MGSGIKQGVKPEVQNESNRPHLGKTGYCKTHKRLSKSLRPGESVSWKYQLSTRLAIETIWKIIVRL